MVQGRQEDGRLVIALKGSIDSSNAPDVETGIKAKLKAHPSGHVDLDCDQLQYCTSAGLRVFLRLKQQVDDLVLTNVHPELYNIFEMTGFADIIEVRKAYRVFSVKDCEAIGKGANGMVYRIDADTIVKVYQNPDALPEIHRERELARLAFIAGVPTAIPYDVVRIEDGGYGSVFELLNADSFAALLLRGEKSMDELVEMSVRLLRLIHSKKIRSEILPDMKAVALDWAMFLKDYLPSEHFERLYALISAVPESAGLMHGDYHIKNVMLQNGESLLIDMDTLCHGHPIFELASMYNAYLGFWKFDPGHAAGFLGLPQETCAAFWRKSLALYLDTRDEHRLDEVEAKAEIIGLTRLIRREIRRDNRAEIVENCRAALMELLPQVDTLVF